jgi:hypothetical protein
MKRPRGCANDAIEEHFAGGDVSRFGADVADVDDAVAAHSPTDTPGLCPFGTIGADDADISGFFVSQHVVGMDEKSVLVPVGILESGPNPWKSWPVSSILASSQRLPTLQPLNSQ